MGLLQSSDVRFAAALFLIAIAFNSLFISYGQSIMNDEGFFLNGALRIIHGQVPYRDFFSMYPPGFWYPLAIVQMPFGSNPYAERFYGLLQAGLDCAIAYLLARKFVQSRWIAAVPALTYVFTTTYVVSNSFRMFFALLGVYALVFYFEKKDRRALIASGLLAGIAVLFSQENGAYIIAASAIAFAVAALMERDYLGRVRDAAMLAGCAALPLLAAAAFFYTQGALPDLIYDLFIFPLGSFQSAMALPYPNPISYLPAIASAPSLLYAAASSFILKTPFPAKDEFRSLSNFILSIRFYYPILVFLLAIVWSTRGAWKREWSWRSASLLLLLAFALLVFKTATTRADYPHLTLASLPFLLLGAVALDAALRMFRESRGGVRLAFAALAMLLLAFPVFFAAESLVYNFYKVLAYDSTLLVSGVGVNSRPDFTNDTEALVAYMGPRIGPADNIVVLPFASIIYTMLGKENPTRYDFIYRDVTPAQQQEIIGSLENKNVEFVIYHNDTVDAYWTMQDYSPEIYDYIMAHYRNESQFGRYTVFRRSG